MQGSVPSMLGHLLGPVLIVGSLVMWTGCDTVPAPDRSRTPPSVAALQVVPDSIHESDLSPDQVQDSTAQVPLQLMARATDADGTVQRVVFVVEPASDPRGTLSGRLPAQPESETQYGGPLVLSLPLVDEIYTIRVFAIDDDSLASNKVTGQLRVVPSGSSTATAVPSLSP